MEILIINGPNLNLLGKREPEIYGHLSFEKYFEKLNSKYSKINLKYFQSNSEGEIIDQLHLYLKNESTGIVLNAGAYTHYSLAIRDAISTIKTPVVEVHISNIFKREKFRKNSVISEVCSGIISGFGFFSYDLAIEFLIKK